MNDLDLGGCTTGEETLMCTAQDTVIQPTQYKEAIEFTVEDIFTKYGPREPVYSTLTKHINAPAIVLTDQAPSNAEITWYDVLFEWWSTKDSYSDQYQHTWHSVTRGNSTISTGYK